MKSQPKWQKVRIVGPLKDSPHLLGREIWAIAGPPIYQEGTTLAGEYRYTDSGIVLALLGDGDLMVAPNLYTNEKGEEVGRVEFLPKFSNHVEPVPFEIWSDPHWQGMEDGILIGEEYGQDVSC